jgi:hypothetical protein
MSNLLEQASLVLIPSGYKEDVVYSEIPLDGSGDMVFSRSSNGTRINSAGLVEVTPWNLLEQSETFDNAYWFKARMSITANTTTAPNGTLTADSFVEDSTNNSHPLYTISPAVIQGLVYTISVYLKKGSRNYFNITPIAGNSVFFDLNNGTATGTGASIESVGNGWYRCIATYTASSTNADIYFQPSPNGTDTYYQGNGSVSAYIWGAQLNIGSTAKPYFPTTDRLNVPRLTYQNGGGGCPSLLLEKQSTNYAIYSQDLNQSVSSLTGGSVTDNNTTSPDGTQNADKFTVSSGTSGHTGYYESPNGTNGSPFTASIFLKAGTGRYFLFRAMTNTYGTRYGVTIDLQSGTILSTNTAGSPTGTASKIENFGNGWYRVSLTMNCINTQIAYVWAASNTATPSLDIYLDYSYTGNGTDSYYIWGMTLENSSYPTSLIQTTSASATRVADACFKTGISSLIGQTEGVLFTDFVCNGFEDYGTPLSVNNGSTTQYVWLTTFANGNIRAELYNAAAQASITYTGGVVGQRYKLAFAYKTNDFAMYVNGSLVGTDVSGTTFSGTDLSRVDFNLTNNAVYGKAILQINQAMLFPTRLTNAELASLTTL